VITSLAGIHGSLLGIVGKSMPEIAGLNVPLLESPEPAEASAETVAAQAN
jgi:hypothetical protein